MKFYMTEAKPYGLHADADSGAYNRKLKRVLGDDRAADEIYAIEVPSYNKKAILREKHRFSMIPAHEEFARHVEEQKFAAELLDFQERAPRAYREHPIVLEAAAAGCGLPMPIALYLDGVPYSHVDSVIGFWMVDLLTARRFLIAVLRKKLVCKCGCKGWCTYQPIFRSIAWSLRSISKGYLPEVDDLGREFREGSTRWIMRGRPMTRRGACLYIKGDWSEYANTLGFPQWGDNLRPCFECAGIHDLYVPVGNTAKKFRWSENDDADYFKACDTCEIDVELTARAVTLIKNAGLRYMKTGKGRCLLSDIAELRLLKGDRLEPSISIPDIGDFESSLGSIATFWRSSRETLTRHRNPLFDPEIGITPKRSLTVDTLHALNLGVYKIWAKVAIWYILLSDVYGRITSLTADLDTAIRVMVVSLSAFQSQNKALTKISDLNRKSIGEKSKPTLKTKGAETWTLILFLLDEFKKHADRLGTDGAVMFEAGDQLRKMNRIFHDSGPVISPADQKNAFEYYSRHMALMRTYEVFTPKHHIIFHMLKKMDYQGNPALYATWLDESLNKMLKKSCKETSQMTFEITILMRMRRVLKDAVGTAKRKFGN